MKLLLTPFICFFLFTGFVSAQDTNLGGRMNNAATNLGGAINNQATQNTKTSLINLKINNPLGVSSVQGLLKRILELLLTIATPIAVLFLLYSGFLFVEARGNSEKLKKAKAVFWNTIIGVAILLGAYTISIVVTETVRSIIQ